MARYLGVDVTNKSEYFFISYNSEDADRVSQYLMAMSEKGLPMWYDYGIEVGDKWSSIIADKIANSKAVIMFLSRQIFGKEESFVHKEWEMARDFFDKKIYVVILDDISKKEVPHRYVSWWIDVNHMQCIMASNYTVDSCADKIISATGYSVISKEEILNQRKPYVVEETNTEEDNKIDIKDCVNETKEQNVNTQNSINEINESKSDDFIIEAGVLKKYNGNASVVRIPYGVTQIGENAFRGCSSLTEIVIPDSVTNIGSCAFWGCQSLTKVLIPDSVTSIGFQVFEFCYSIKYNIYDYARYLGNENNPYLVLVKANDSSIKSSDIHEKTRIILDYAFKNCTSLTKIVIPDSVTSIGVHAFEDCGSLTEIVIPDSVTRIAFHTFENCTSLTEIVIPDSVTSIGRAAFSRCSKLKVIKYKGTKEKWSKISRNSHEFLPSKLLKPKIKFI